MEIKGRTSLFVAWVGMMSCVIYGMESLRTDQDKAVIKIYALPGLGGSRGMAGGSSTDYIRTLFEGYECDVRRLETPDEHSDLGQTKCIAFVRRALQQDTDPEGFIVHATSQGATTMLNMGELDPRIKGLILEGGFMSGNQGIVHSIHGKRDEGYGILKYMPLVDIWAPYLTPYVKLPHYSPTGLQPIKALSIPDKIPVVIVHGRQDQRVPPDDAYALYHRLSLRSPDNKNTYLITREGADHTHVLQDSEYYRNVLQSILRKQGVLPPRDGIMHEADLTPYQPDHSLFKHYYDEIYGRHMMHEYVIAPTIYASVIAAGLGVTYVVTNSLINLYKRTVKKE